MEEQKKQAQLLAADLTWSCFFSPFIRSYPFPPAFILTTMQTYHKQSLLGAIFIALRICADDP